MKPLLHMTKLVGDTTVPASWPTEQPADTRVKTVKSAAQQVEEQARLQALRQIRSSASERLSQAKVDHKFVKQAAVGAAVRATKLADRLSDAKVFAYEAKEEAEVARVIETVARVASKQAEDSLTEVELTSATLEREVGAAKRHRDELVAASKKAAEEVDEESYQDIVHGLEHFTWVVGLAEESRERVRRCMQSNMAVEPSCRDFLDWNVHNPDLLEPPDEFLTELSTEDVAAVRTKGMDMAGAMSAATALTIDKARVTMDPAVPVYLPLLQETASLAMHEEMVVREAVKLAALERVRCKRQRASAALSLAAEHAGRALDEAMADRTDINTAWENAADRANSTGLDLDRAQMAKEMCDKDVQETAKDVRDLQKGQARAATEQARLEAAALPLEAKLVEARFANGRAILECAEYCLQLRE